MLYNINRIHLHRVFHGIRFKVNNEDWLSVMDSLFSFIYTCKWKHFPRMFGLSDLRITCAAMVFLRIAGEDCNERTKSQEIRIV